MRKNKLKSRTLFMGLVASICLSTVPTTQAVAAISSPKTSISSQSRGSCHELVKKGFKYKNCGQNGPSGRPKGGTVVVTHAQWNCLIRMTGGMQGMFLSPYIIPLALWDMYDACHNL